MGLGYFYIVSASTQDVLVFTLIYFYNINFDQGQSHISCHLVQYCQNI